MKSFRIRPAYSYVIGYVLALALTLNAYVAATLNVGTMNPSLYFMLIVLSAAQLMVHAIYFLHLGHEGRPRWNTLAMIITVMVLLFIVIGSVWIMNNLDYNMMSPQSQQQMIDDEGIQ